MVVLSLTKVKYITFTLLAKKATWLGFFLIKLSLLKFNDQYAKINVKIRIAVLVFY